MKATQRLDKNLIKTLRDRNISIKVIYDLLTALDRWMTHGLLNPQVSQDYLSKVNEYTYQILECYCIGMTDSEIDLYRVMIAYCQRKPYRSS